MPTTAPAEKAAEVKTLSHYTTLQGFIGIVESGQMWASNVAYLNDREELLHGIKCARKALNGVFKDRKIKKWDSAITQAVGLLENGAAPNTYAACFCERSDLLSQWRGYGGSQQGISIQFERIRLDALRAGPRSYLAPVQYGLVDGRVGMTNALRERLLSSVDENSGDLSDDKQVEAARRILGELIPRFKHIGFKAELEWRLVVLHETYRKTVCFRPGQNVVIPYLKLEQKGELLPVKSVKIGPGSDISLTQKSVENYLKARGYEVPVHASNVPFRT